MIRKRHNYSHLCFKTRKRLATTSALAIDSSHPITRIPTDHQSFCFHLAHNLLQRGLLSSAQSIIQRLISRSSSIPDAISAIDFASFHGMDLGLGIYGAFIRKMMDLRQFKWAYDIYCHMLISGGIEPDSNIVNSIIICLVKLGKLEDAKVLFDKLLAGSDSLPSKTACNAILTELCSQEMFLEAFDYFRRISDAKIKLGFWIYNMLIDGLCLKGLVSEAMEVFDMMCERVPPTLHLFKSLFYALCKNRQPVEAELVFEEMEAQGFYVDRVMYTSLMYAYCSDRKMKMAVRIYFRMLKMGCMPDSYTYNTLIYGFFKMGLVDKGWMLYNQMNEAGLQPNAVTFHALISNYCKQGKVDGAMMLLNNMIHLKLVPSVHCYTTLIGALYKENRFMEVDELYRNMLDAGIVPDHIMCFVLMKNSPKGHELAISLLMLQAIAKNGCGLDPPVFPGSSNINPAADLEKEIDPLLQRIVRSNSDLANVASGIYISALSERGKTDAALACLGNMVNIGFCPLPFTFNSVIKCLCKDGHYEDVMSLIEIMQQFGRVPDLITYLIMVNEYCKRKDLVSAFGLLDLMEEKGLKPDVAIYDSIIRCLSREKKMCEAETLFLRMLEAGVDPDETLYMTMINGYFMNGRALEAHQLFEMMVENAIQPTSYTYTTMISGLVKRNMTYEGCTYLDRMLGDGLVPNAVLYTSLIKHFLRNGEIRFAFRLIDLMDRNQIEADLIFYIVLVSGVCRNITGIKKRWCAMHRTSYRAREMLFHLLHQESFLPGTNTLTVTASSPEELKYLALKLVHKMKGNRFMPDLYLYNGIISGLCKADRMEDAYSNFELMQRDGIIPNEVTFTILMRAHIAAGEIDHAIRLCNMMTSYGCMPDEVAYSTLLKGLCKYGRGSDALSVLYAMHKRGFFPSKNCYENLLHCFCATYLSIPALKIFEEMLAYNYVPRRYTCDWLICFLCEDKKLDVAHMVFDMLLERGKFPYELENGDSLSKCAMNKERSSPQFIATQI